LLISGGVFLIDSAGQPNYQLGTSLLPLFMRDLGASVDAGRLTTAAGRLDKLDLYDVCVSEQCEEMIFFGTIPGSNNAHVLICAPPAWYQLAKKTTLDRLLRKRIPIPGIDLKQIEQAQRTGDGPIYWINTSHLTPKQPFKWKVEIFYRDDDKQPWKKRHEYDDFILIPDEKAATLEFRALWLSHLTAPLQGGNGAAVGYNAQAASLGQLLGIVDGDGYGRSALVVKAFDLTSYVDSINQMTIADLLFQSDQDNSPALKLLAVTDSRTGRFVTSDKRLPVAPLTTSVKYFVNILKNGI
jgi:hypothetical protein